MQRINWFPDPNITQAFAPFAPSTMKIDFPFVDRRNWMRATVRTVGDCYAARQRIRPRLHACR